DIVLKELLVHLSEFASKDRYVYMNRISDEASTGKWLSHRWGEIEAAIIPFNQAIQMIENGQEREYTAKISTSLVVVIEWLLGALCRTITLGKMDSDSNSVGTLLHDFIIRESELGTRKYELFGYSPV
ncbi:MAG: hypothetical protein HC808_09865, partial [Candidatus Competibacteraceae bacterium]|nr:hypothetical protein [Candidatus Competibacteraceae bacterium]